jgi:hypothetical protein
MRYFLTIVFALGAAVLLGGCSTSDDETVSDIPVRAGLSRDGLKSRYGEPLRIEHTASGGEDWYYRFVSRKPTREDSTTSSDASGTTTTYSATWEPGKTREERAIHLSPEGFVIEPIPEGKVAWN